MLPDGVRLIHIRHGETDWNAEGRLQGRNDIPINARGRAQAERNGRALADRLAADGRDPASFRYVSSPLTRSAETMRIIRAALGGLDGEAETDPVLMEVDFGEWSGFTYEDLKAAGQGNLVKARKRDKWSFRPPGGETYAELSERIGGWLEGVRQDTVAVTHGGVYRVLHGLIVGTPFHQVPGLPAPQDRVAVFQGGRIELF
jgi:probable phosphoglycerate mutase